MKMTVEDLQFAVDAGREIRCMNAALRKLQENTTTQTIGRVNIDGVSYPIPDAVMKEIVQGQIAAVSKQVAALGIELWIRVE